MKRLLFTAFVLIFGSLLFTACRKAVDVPANGPAASGGGETAAAVPKGTSPIGTWYEQKDAGGVLEVTKDTIRYTPYSALFVDEAPLKIVDKGKTCLLETEEEDYFYFVDISYDKGEDTIQAYTMPMLDGDGGYKLRTFARTPYVAPPAPTYDPPKDNTDPEAKKEFDDMTVRSLNVSFFDEGAYYDPSSNMAPMPPYEDKYSYDLTVQEDGSARVSSSFCQEIILPKEIVDELQALVDEADLGSINGVDIRTEGLPYDAPDYELELTLSSGDVIRSTANGPDVPTAWSDFQKPLHYLLYFSFVNAGYHMNGGEFHSTAPMKRPGTGRAPAKLSWKKMLEASSEGYYYGDPEEESETEAPAKLNVSWDTVLVKPDWKKSYDYSLDTKYLKFISVEPSRPELMKTLLKLNEEYKQRAEAALKEDYETMEAVPASVRKKADRLYAYSLFTVAHGTDHGLFYSFLVSEGHANSLGVGKYGYGYYPNITYNIDTETGKILTVADLFTDRKTAYQVILDSMVGSWGTHNEAGQFIHSEEFPKKLDEFLDKTGPGSINWTATYDYLELYFPTDMFTMYDSSVREILYYDELQDVLNDRYCTVW